MNICHLQSEKPKQKKVKLSNNAFSKFAAFVLLNHTVTSGWHAGQLGDICGVCVWCICMCVLCMCGVVCMWRGCVHTCGCVCVYRCVMYVVYVCVLCMWCVCMWCGCACGVYVYIRAVCVVWRVVYVGWWWDLPWVPVSSTDCPTQ